MSDFNAQMIEELRANGGRASGQFEGAPLLILHHLGRKSGTERENPVMYMAVGDDFAVFASKAGAPDNPDWFHNLLTNPGTTVEVLGETVPVTARVTEGEERGEIWEAQKAAYPGFADYESKTTREIPVVMLERTRPD
jgi:deazaflavin-dependent oxidoreductase (nitroreductase family)